MVPTNPPTYEKYVSILLNYLWKSVETEDFKKFISAYLELFPTKKLEVTKGSLILVKFSIILSFQGKILQSVSTISSLIKA